MNAPCEIEARTAICKAVEVDSLHRDYEKGVERGHIRCILLLFCFGAEINKYAIDADKTGLIVQINDRLKLLRDGNRMGTSLMGNEERRFMWNLAFCFTIAHRGASFKAYYAIRSFITFHGIFMAPGYELGEDSVVEDKTWRIEPF